MTLFTHSLLICSQYHFFPYEMTRREKIVQVTKEVSDEKEETATLYELWNIEKCELSTLIWRNQNSFQNFEHQNHWNFIFQLNQMTKTWKILKLVTKSRSRDFPPWTTKPLNSYFMEKRSFSRDRWVQWNCFLFASLARFLINNWN